MYLDLISVTQTKFNALKTSAATLDRPVAFFITDAAPGAPNIVFGRTGQTPTQAETTGATTTGTSSAGGGLRQWEPAKAFAQGDIVVASFVQGTIGIGDLIIRNAAGTSGATFDAAEAATWTEVANDPDVATATSLSAHTGSTSNPHSVTKAQVGLGNADNTSDANKPVSSAVQGALNQKYDQTQAVIDLSSKADNVHTHTEAQVTGLTAALAAKQATLVSGTNIKTVNYQSLLGSGDLAIGASAASVTTRAGGTGGAITQVGNDRVHTFTSGGNFVVPAGVSAVQVLAVAGGGGGGTGRYAGDTLGRPGGGGGAGGRILNTAFAVTPGATIPVTVGIGGAGATDLADTDNGGTGGVNGGDSVFSTLTAIGGGGGGGHYQVQQGAEWNAPANVGGSGGGGSNGSAGAAGTSGQGSAGGGMVAWWLAVLVAVAQEVQVAQEAMARSKAMLRALVVLASPVPSPAPLSRSPSVAQAQAVLLLEWLAPVVQPTPVTGAAARLAAAATDGLPIHHPAVRAAPVSSSCATFTSLWIRRSTARTLRLSLAG